MATSDSNPDLPQDPLDECLKNARWPEPTGLARNRLEAQWESLALSRFQSRRRMLRWTLAASVVLALGLSIGGWLLFQPEGPEIIPNVPNLTSPNLADGPAIKRDKPTAEEPWVRIPTRYEEAAFRAAVKHRQRSGDNPQAKPLVQTLNRILVEPEANVAELCQPLKTRRATYEELILARLGAWNLAEQRAALKVLREIGSPQAIPVLDHLSRDPEFAKDAWPVALHLAPVKLLGEWAKSGTPSQKKDAMQKLLSQREDPSALGMMLHLVALPDSRTLAVSVIAADPNPPIEPLFAYLKGGTTKQRHTAGLVLGQLKNPKVTKELLAMAKGQSFPPEVMLGLLNSRDRDAAKFLKQATQHPEARSAVQLACLEWQMISYVSRFPHPLEIH